MGILKRWMLVAIEFDDHVEDGSKPERFVVYGRVARVRKDAVCIDSWAYPNPRKRFDPNVKRFTILRRVIVSVTELVPQDGGVPSRPPEKGTSFTDPAQTPSESGI